MFDLMPFEHKTRNMSNYFDDLEKTFFGGLNKGFSEIRTDIVDKGDKYLLQAELPGFSKEEIRIDLNGETLTISAEHKEEKEEKKDNYLRRERRYGSFARSFDVSEIQTDQIGASYNNGVLELTLPKANPRQPSCRTIELK